MGWQLEVRFAVSARNRAIISNRYALAHQQTGDRVEQPDWEWAERFGDVVQYAARGALCQARLSPRGQPEDVRLIRDFAGMAFEPLEAPYAGTTAP